MNNVYFGFLILFLLLIFFPGLLFADYDDYSITDTSFPYQYPFSSCYSHYYNYNFSLYNEIIETEIIVPNRLIMQYNLFPYSYSKEDKKELFKDVRLWKWITLCSSILNFSPFLIMAFGGGEESGIAAGVSHSIWSISTLALGISYNKYVDNLNKYGLADTSSYIGLCTAFASGFFGVITVSLIPGMMDSHTSTGIIIMMVIGSALTNLIGGYSLVHTFIYESSL